MLFVGLNNRHLASSPLLPFNFRQPVDAARTVKRSTDRLYVLGIFLQICRPRQEGDAHLQPERH